VFLYSIYICDLLFTLLALYFIMVSLSLSLLSLSIYIYIYISFSLHIILIVVFLYLIGNKLYVLRPINYEFNLNRYMDNSMRYILT